MKKFSPESVHLAHRSKRERLSTEDFVILVVHSDRKWRQNIVSILKSGDFTTYTEDGSKGAIGSALMLTPNILVFDWDNNPDDFIKTREFIRSQKLAKHISHCRFIVFKNKSSDKTQLLELNDPNLKIIEEETKEKAASVFRKQILSLFLQAQKEYNDNFQSEEIAAAKQSQTASLNRILQQHKSFNESVIRSFSLLVNQVPIGDSRKIFDTIVKTLEILNRPFILKFHAQDNNVYEQTYGKERTTDSLEKLLKETIKLNGENQNISKLYSDHDRRCFFGEEKKLYFATESPTIFDELDNFSMVTKNFEMFLIQAEKRKIQMQHLEKFRLIFHEVYASMTSFEWSESLEEMQDLVEQMFAIDTVEEKEEEISGEIEFF